MTITGSRLGRRLAKACLAVGTATVILTSGAPAYAANITASITGYARASFNPADNYWYEVCDLAADGKGVYGIFTSWVGLTPYRTYIWDSNGSSAGCQNGHHWSTYIDRADIVTVQVCVDTTAPAGSVYVPGQPQTDMCSKVSNYNK